MNAAFRFLLFLSLAFAPSALALAQGYWDLPVQVLPGPGYLTAPAAGSGRIVIAGATHDSEYVFQSTDRGRTWLERSAMYMLPNWFGGGTGLLGAAADSSGALWVLTSGRDYDYAPSHYGLLKFPPGGGPSSGVDLGYGQDSDARLAVGRSGDVYVVWRRIGAYAGRITLTCLPRGDEKRRTDVAFSGDSVVVRSFDLTLDPRGLPLCVWSGGLSSSGASSFLTCTGSSDSAHLLDRILRSDSLPAPSTDLSIAGDGKGAVFILCTVLSQEGKASMSLARIDTSGAQSGPPAPLEPPSSSAIVCVDSLGGVNVASDRHHLRSSDGGKTFVELEPPPGAVTGLIAGPHGELYATCKMALPPYYVFCRRTGSGGYSSFYPLQTGNFWNYAVTDLPFTPQAKGYRKRITVLGDTLMPNGLTYWQLSAEDPLWAKWVRIDSGSVHYYDGFRGKDEKVFNLQAPAGFRDSIHWNLLMSMSVSRVDSILVLGKWRLCRGYHGDGLTMFNLTFAESLGIVQCWDMGDVGPYNRAWNLIGGSRGGVTYGTLDYVPAPPTISDRFLLEQNYPNPFNPTTTIRYSLPHRSHVTLTVFNMLGQKVAELVNSDIDAGVHDARFDAGNLASGVYFYRLQAEKYSSTRRLIVLK